MENDDAESLIGLDFGLWQVVAEAEPTPAGRARVLCACRCGTERPVLVESLRAGKSQSCGGCGSRLKHGHSRGPGPDGKRRRTRTYNSWRDAKERGTRPKAKDRRYYEGVGWDPAWNQFEQFLADMGEAPPGCTLDRINPFGPYAPENCRWAPKSEQSRNTRRAWVRAGNEPAYHGPAPERLASRREERWNPARGRRPDAHRRGRGTGAGTKRRGK